MNNTHFWMACLGICVSGCTKKEKDGIATDSPFAETGAMEGMTAAHNEIRRAHGVRVDLVWDEALAEISLEWLNHLDLDNNCQMEHNWDSPLGENLMWATFYMNAQEIVDGWASEEAFYDYNSNTCEDGEMCSHYTQVVWKDTTHVGCAMITCQNETEYMWMCNYDPAGNWEGEKPY